MQRVFAYVFLLCLLLPYGAAAGCVRPDCGAAAVGSRSECDTVTNSVYSLCTELDEDKYLPVGTVDSCASRSGESAPELSVRDTSATVAEADTAAVQLSLRQKVRRTGNIFLRFVRSFDDIDTTYIEPNHYNLAAMMQNTNFYQTYVMSATDAQGNRQELQLGPQPAAKVGPYFGWRWIFLGYTFDVSHPKEAGKTTEFNLSLYSSMLGCDLVYIRNKGDFRLRRATGFGDVPSDAVRGMSFDGFDTYTASLSAYYVFNHRRFSYPAAFAQSTVQRRSCGSWVLGVSYNHQRMRFDHTRLPAVLQGETNGGESLIFDEFKIAQVDYRSYSVSGGYAYNWVFARNFLFSGSVTPALGFRKSHGERVTGKTFWTGMKDMNFDCLLRLGLVWNNTRWFAGASAVSHIFDYQRDRLSLTNAVCYINVYVGFNFLRRK